MPTVTIAAHSRVYTDMTVAVDGGTLTTYHDGSAIADGDTLYVYYDDPARAGGAVTYLATATSGNAICSGDNPSRHFVGSITVPSTGSTTTATGSLVSPGGTSGFLVNHIDNGLK